DKLAVARLAGPQKKIRAIVVRDSVDGEEQMPRSMRPGPPCGYERIAQYPVGGQPSLEAFALAALKRLHDKICKDCPARDRPEGCNRLSCHDRPSPVAPDEPCRPFIDLDDLRRFDKAAVEIVTLPVPRASLPSSDEQKNIGGGLEVDFPACGHRTFGR